MDDATFKELVKRLYEINKVVEKLDPAIRGQAFALLESYVGTGAVTSRRPESDRDREEETAEPAGTTDLDADLEAFVAKHESDAPADNAKTLAAFLYTRRGKAPFTAEEIDNLGKHAGLTVPERIDVILKGAKVKGKALFRQDGNTFTPTVHGEAFFKSNYKVKKGKLLKPSST